MAVKGRFAAVAFLVAVQAWPVTAAEQEKATVVKGAQASAPVRPVALDVDLRDLPVVREWQSGDPIKEVPRRAYPRPGQVLPPASQDTPPDPLLALQEEAGDTGFAPPLNLNFDAQNFTGVNPPDTVGDVGPNHYIQMINHSSGSSVVIYNKSGGVLAGPFILDTLGLPAPCNSGLGDPIVLYDQLADRWMLSEFASSGANLCVYVSQTNNPVSGGWFGYRFQTPSFPDYPKYAVWPDAYYVGTNEPSPAVYALDRARMLIGQPATLQRFTAPPIGAFPFEMLVPADLDGAVAPPAGAPGLFLRHRDDEVHNPPGIPGQDSVEIFEFRVNWTTPASSTFTGPISVPVAEFSSELCGLSSFNCFPQPGSGITLDPLREVFMQRVHYRNFGTHQTLGGNFVTDADGEASGDPLERGGVRFVEMRKTTGGWFLFQEGTFSPDTNARWLAGTAIDQDGNWGLVHNISSTSVFPGIRFTGRLSSDPLGTLQAEGTIVNGSAANSSNRWGDYAALSVDPSDDCTFWYTGMYNPVNLWRTRIATFKHPTCATRSISVNDVTLAEGNAGTTNAVFTISLSAPAAAPVTVNFATANGSATAPADYQVTTGSRTFGPGVTTQTVSVPVVGETAVEPHETFTLNLSGPVNATITDGQGVGTILNDDFPAISVNDVAVTEGDTGSVKATFTVSLSQPSPFAASVNYGTSPGTATAAVDYGAVGGTVNFPPGVTSQPVEVPVLGDRIDEANETYSLDLSGPAGATLADPQGQGTINDNDNPGFTINDVTVRERYVPATATARFTVTLSPTQAGTTTVSWATANGTATAPGDYISGGATLTFPGGTSTQTLDVVVNSDALIEGAETFLVNLSASSGPPIAFGSGTGRILDRPAGGDFNGDLRNDFLWRHDVSGENVLWFMNGANLISGTFTTPPTLTDVRWKMVGTNDFNTDGKPDILWRHNTSGENVLWFMNGSVLTSGTFLTPSSLADVRWGMSGTGDFNLDGRPDILWRHNVSGEIVVWFMNGSVLVSGNFLTPSAFADVNWETVGTGDFNVDGKPDILWRHALSGQNVVWFMDGTSLVSGAFTNPPTLADVRWRMSALEDYNFDGRVDIVWRHSTSGENVLWFMNGINLISGTFTNPSSLPDTNWKIVGPR
jgi:hypothetical protein